MRNRCTVGGRIGLVIAVRPGVDARCMPSGAQDWALQTNAIKTTVLCFGSSILKRTAHRNSRSPVMVWFLSASEANDASGYTWRSYLFGEIESLQTESFGLTLAIVAILPSAREGKNACSSAVRLLPPESVSFVVALKAYDVRHLVRTF